jgi:hypothetical protein
MNILFIGERQPETRNALKVFDDRCKRGVRHFIANSLEEIMAVPKIDVVTSFEEGNILTLMRAIPYLGKKFPSLNLPTARSLAISTDKYLMRQAFLESKHDISAKSILIDHKKIDSEVERIGGEFGEQVVIKPSHNASSLYVSLVNNKRVGITEAFNKIIDGYERNRNGQEPQILVEEFLEGPMYTVDAYIDATGKSIFCPPVMVLTGMDIGHNDFYGFYRTTPVDLSVDDIKSLEFTVSEGIKAMGLKNISAHVELRLTKNGWRILEIGARIGGYRDLMYRNAFGFEHAANDILNRLGEKPIVVSSKQNYSGVIKLYPKIEGRLKAIKGLGEAVKKYREITVIEQKPVGSKRRLAANGGLQAATLSIYSGSAERNNEIVDWITRNVEVVTE